jgi:hypothetical protein
LGAIFAEFEELKIRFPMGPGVHYQSGTICLALCLK